MLCEQNGMNMNGFGIGGMCIFGMEINFLWCSKGKKQVNYFFLKKRSKILGFEEKFLVYHLPYLLSVPNKMIKVKAVFKIYFFGLFSFFFLAWFSFLIEIPDKNQIKLVHSIHFQSSY
jgi:hypothetical protein